MLALTEEQWNELYESRVLLMFEVEPQSNRYQQIVLNKKQYRAITNHLSNYFNGPKKTSIIPCSGEFVTLPDQPSFYTK